MLVSLAVAQAQALIVLDPVGGLLGLVGAILDGVQPLVARAHLRLLGCVPDVGHLRYKPGSTALVLMDHGQPDAQIPFYLRR